MGDINPHITFAVSFGLSMTSPIDASIVTTTLPIVTMVVAAIYLKAEVH